MKIKLLKALPWYEVGHIFDQEPGCCVWYTLYLPDELINTGWAEELSEAPKTVWDLKIGDVYYLTFNDSSKGMRTWENTITHEERRKYNNCFLTQEDAEFELLRRESRAKAWMPEEGENSWSIDSNGQTFARIWEGDYIDMIYYHNGHIHKTEEEAIEWGEKYGKAFGLT